MNHRLFSRSISAAVIGLIGVVVSLSAPARVTRAFCVGDCLNHPIPTPAVTFFSPGDGRLDPHPGDHIAVYYNASSHPPTLDIWGVDGSSRGHRLVRLNIGESDPPEPDRIAIHIGETDPPEPDRTAIHIGETPPDPCRGGASQNLVIGGEAPPDPCRGGIIHDLLINFTVQHSAGGNSRLVNFTVRWWDSTIGANGVGDFSKGFQVVLPAVQ